LHISGGTAFFQTSRLLGPDGDDHLPFGGGQETLARRAQTTCECLGIDRMDLAEWPTGAYYHDRIDLANFIAFEHQWPTMSPALAPGSSRNPNLLRVVSESASMQRRAVTSLAVLLSVWLFFYALRTKPLVTSSSQATAKAVRSRNLTNHRMDSEGDRLDACRSLVSSSNSRDLRWPECVRELIAHDVPSKTPFETLIRKSWFDSTWLDSATAYPLTPQQFGPIDPDNVRGRLLVVLNIPSLNERGWAPMLLISETTRNEFAEQIALLKAGEQATAQLLTLKANWSLPSVGGGGQR
jgi:hypothetical protein